MMIIMMMTMVMMMMLMKSVSMNAAMNMMTINGRDVDSVEKMLRQLTYVNSRLFPTPAARPLTVETHVKYVATTAARRMNIIHCIERS